MSTAKSIKGRFEVKAAPLEGDAVMAAVGAIRMKFDKTFSGALDATSVVSFMGAMDQKTGSGAYVALEKITGTVNGRRGSFGLQHSCSMERGRQIQSITVIPDSGTDDLVGLRGSMMIDIVEGQHFYTFTYEI